MAAAVPFYKQLFQEKRPEPSYPTLPAVDEASDETNIDGVYAVGELAGTPLVLLGLNAGHELVERIGPELKSSRTESHGEDVYDVLIVGSGSSGLAASVAAQGPWDSNTSRSRPQRLPIRSLR